MLTARLRLLSYSHHPLQYNTTVSFHTGADETMARVRLLEGESLQPGETTWAQFLLRNPVAVVNGDHFIIRSTTETLGGGKIIDSRARRLRRLRPTVIENLRIREEGTAQEIIMALLETQQPLELSALLAKCELPANDVQPALEDLIQSGKAVKIGQGEHYLLQAISGWKSLTQKVVAIVRDYHQKFPTRSSMSKAELSNKVRLQTHFPLILQKLFDDGILIEEGLGVHLPGHQIQLTPTQQTKMDIFLDSLNRSPYAPPSDTMPEPELLNLLIKRHDVVKVGSALVFATSIYDEMIEKITSHIKEQGKVTLPEVRDMFNTSRKYAQALLEHMDDKKITRRIGDERVLH